jgi:hypothetical protein
MLQLKNSQIINIFLPIYEIVLKNIKDLEFKHIKRASDLSKITKGIL